MSYIIYKYKLPIRPSSVDFDWPEYSSVLSVGVQEDGPVMWVEHDLSSVGVTKTRTFSVIWTGLEFDFPEYTYADHIGTYTYDGLVCHLYEIFKITPQS